MERRDALRALGGTIAVLSGCGSRESSPGSTTATPLDVPAVRERVFSRFESSDPDEVTLAIARDDVPADWRSGFHVAVFTREYPRGSVVESGRSGVMTGIEEGLHTVSISLDGHEAIPDAYLHRVAEIRKGDPPTDDPAPGAGRIVAETDRFRLESGEVVVDPHPETVESTTQQSYRREAAEGAYHITIEGRETDWEVPLRVFKSEFVLGRTGWRGHDYPPYVEQAVRSGLARSLSAELTRAGTVLGRDPIPFAVEVVQALPYVPESVTEAADEYIKYPAETLVDGGGDCEDSAILLASLIQEPPIGRDCALIHPPHHMGLGIAGEYSGTYYPYEGERYFYVETTGSGWEIGELPEEYADTSALVFQV